MGRRNDYDKEYKENITKAVIQARKNGKSISESAKEYGIPDSSLHRWVREYKKNGTFVGSGNIKPENEEIVKLRKLTKDLQEENDILKKAAAYFAKNQK